MIELECITPKDRFGPPQEYWKIDDDIKISIVRYDNGETLSIKNIVHCDHCAMLSAKNNTGDIADQIYEQAKTIEYFSDLKLVATSNYSICLPLEKLEDFLKYIEKINRSTLKEGRCY